MTALLDLTASSSLVLNGLRLTESSLSDTVSRISSGLRVTTVSDDVAAYMMGVRLQNRTRGWNEAAQNIQNGLSLLETADGGAQGIHAALQRMRELAVEAANGIHTSAEREALSGELDALRQQVFDTVQNTQFNGRQLLAGTGTQAPPTIDISAIAPAAVAPGYTRQTQTGDYHVHITQPAMRGAIYGSQPAQALNGGDPPIVITIATGAGTATATITDADPPASWPGIINAAIGALGVSAEITDNTTLLDDGTLVDPAGFGYLLFRTTGVGSNSSVTVSTNSGVFVDATGFNSLASTAFGGDMMGTIGTDPLGVGGTPFTANGLDITAGPGSAGATGLSFTFTSQPPVGYAGFVHVDVPPEVVTEFTHVVQMAPDHLDEHLISLPALRVDALDDEGPDTLGTLSFATQADAQAALDVIDAAIAQLSAARAKIGAHIQGLNHELTLAGTGAYMTSTAESRVMDADMAVETTSLVQAQIQQQTGLSVMQALHTQANTSLDFVVQMLQSSPLQSA